MTKFSAPQQNQLAQIGAFLRDNREKQSKSLEDIAIRTYIRPQLLNGIETGDPEMLPEPIFVQGFIRRYGEALGLNGIELSQQFTVTSIPSTPRPARQAPPTDSPTTRLSRAGASNAGRASSASSASTANSNSMFSAGAVASSATNAANDGSDALTLGREQSIPIVEPASAFAPADDFNDTVSGIANEPVSPDVTTTVSASGSPSSLDVEEDFASKIAAFDKANLANSDVANSGAADLTPAAADSFDSIPTSFATTSSVGVTSPDTSADTVLSTPPAEATFDSFNTESTFTPDVTTRSVSDATSPALNSQATVDNTLNNKSFDDGLPAAFTTQSTASSVPEPVAPVGVEYDNYDQPNLKPFIIGGVVAAIATGAIILASVLGGGNRQPSVVADSTDTTEQVAEGSASELPPIPEDVTPVETTPPVSSAPVYVEAKAISEAWVSIIADDNPTPIFEGTLQPGESEVWEAQESLSVYSGDAGALQLSANGSEAEVMGEPGQPEEKIFP